MAYRHMRHNAPGYACVLASSGAALAYLYPHTVGLKHYTPDSHRDTPGLDLTLDVDIRLMAEEIKSELRWSQRAEMTGSVLELIPSRSLELSHAGSMATKWGAVVGVPVHFSPHFLPQARHDSRLLSDLGIDAASEQGEAILRSLALSRHAKKFALAREMCQAKSSRIYVNAFVLGVSVTCCYLVTRALSQAVAWRGATLLSFLLVVPTVTFAYLQAFDYNTRASQRRADVKAAGLGESVARAGLDFYQAVVVRERLATQTTLGGGHTDTQRHTDTRTHRHTERHTDTWSFMTEPERWFAAFRKPGLTAEERREGVGRVVERLYGRGGGGEEGRGERREGET
ncbi:uncharacterized protein LOC101853113 [Aplysia californica]|uniref:Uncharacterized protein LOC101853113 n=1 Tax=Aplysia californica TaxID=6500 RepID=A0ABM1A6U6_APLCA|nr:uncharacterized protein LOC101853113 [Aplysia californica]XP_012941972.1 uncharacterized protein LOC101853113 [Aplysia californica]